MSQLSYLIDKVTSWYWRGRQKACIDIASYLSRTLYFYRLHQFESRVQHWMNAVCFTSYVRRLCVLLQIEDLELGLPLLLDVPAFSLVIETEEMRVFLILFILV